MDASQSESILGPGGAIARRMDAYESRPEQLAMAAAVERAIAGGGHLMVEAGTGVGKSFAYLVPAILAAVESGKKVVVSTHTISLQEQLLLKDIPFLRAVMPQEFTATLVKGRGNYISLRRLEAAAARAGGLLTRPEDLDDLASVKIWAGGTEDGSRSDLDFRPAPSVWEMVQSDRGNCLGKKCRTYKSCFYYAARRRMNTANLLVVNHALFMTDLALRGRESGFLPDYDVVIFDEAHTLDAVAASHLGLRAGKGQVDYLLGRLYNPRSRKGLLAYYELTESIAQVGRCRMALEDFFEGVAAQARRVAPANGRIRKPLDVGDVLGLELRKLASAIDAEAEAIEDDDARLELASAADSASALAATATEWLEQRQPDSVYWVEQTPSSGGRPRIELACAPIDVGPILRRDLFDRVPTCILASATLGVGNPPSFDFAKKQIGLTKCESLELGSPFDYPNRVSIHVPRNLPDPSLEPREFDAAAIRAIPFYLEKTGGRAFVLFTSHKMLDEAARTLAPWFAARNIRLLAQGEGMPRSKMIEAFKADVDSVLFGAESFWQGVDVPGEALSNVVIVRLPFSVPRPSPPGSPPRRHQATRRRPVPRLPAPQAVLKLKQGFGRLIRSRTDSGIVAILDPRVLTKPYGRTFLDSLPKCPRVVDVIAPTAPGRGVK